MDVRVITLRYQDALQGFSEEALRKAISGREVLEAREHFFLHGNVPHLLLTLLLGDVPAGGEAFRRSKAPDPEEGLEEERRPLYRELKRWRNERARLLRTRRKFRLRERQYLAREISGAQLARCAAAADGGNRWYGFRGILQSSGVLEDEGIWAGGEGAESGSNRVKRGGSWNNTASNCRSANRNSNSPSNRNNNIGFRLVSTML